MAKTRAKNKPNATGRSMTTRFARLDHRLLESSAYRALSPNARALLVELTMLENGNNNGSLWLSVRDGAARWAWQICKRLARHSPTYRAWALSKCHKMPILP
jgi:hypothetical protein